MCRYFPHQNNYIICCANGILSFLQFVIEIQINLIRNNRLLWFMYCTDIVKMININLFIEEGRKREVNHPLGLFKTIFYDLLCVLSILNQNARWSNSFRERLLWKVSINNISIINVLNMWRYQVWRVSKMIRNER